MKRLFALAASLILLLPFITVPDAGAVVFQYKDKLYSESALLMSLDTNEVIYEKNPDSPQCPGTLVNIMTAVIVLENCRNLSEEVTLDPIVYKHIYDNLYDPEDLPMVELQDGDVLSVNDMLYCMMLTSSVEASETLANHVGKQLVAAGKANGMPVEAFVGAMNDKAKEIGMNSTVFTNANGMYDTAQYTTARDMATLTKYALNVPLFREIATAQSYTPVVPNPKNHPKQDAWIWTHSNVMTDPTDNVYYYMGAKGIKTAKLEAAGRNIITTASRNGYTYLVVLMKAPFKDEDGDNTFCHIKDAKGLLDWAFDHFSNQVILAATTEIGERPVKLADSGDKSFIKAVPKEEVQKLWCDDVNINLIDNTKPVWYKDTFKAPIEKGEVIGELPIYYNGEVIATVELVAQYSIDRSKTKYNLEVAKRFHKSKWFSNAIKITVILSLMYILICVYAYVVFKSHKKPLKPIYAVPKMNKKKKKNNSQNEK
ncbi:MAG: D-alanyl-D-alanine carboxypeptidase [Ruminococcus sp.]|nr:D-alanyl-D-alanine carboxypeptidase [Ruminococcus sp.]